MIEEQSQKDILAEINSQIDNVLDRVGSSIALYGDDFGQYVQQLRELKELVNSLHTFSACPSESLKNSYFSSSPILQKWTPTLQSTPINHKTFLQCLKSIHNLLRQILNYKQTDRNFIYSKMHYTGFYLTKMQDIVKLDKEDLFSLERDHPKWQMVRSVVETIEVAPQEKIKKVVKVMRSLTSAICAFLEGTMEGPFTVGRLVPTIKKAVKLARTPGLAEKACTEFKKNVNPEKVRLLFGGLDLGLTGFFIKSTLQSVKYNKIVYITPSYPHLTEDSVQKRINKQTPKPLLVAPSPPSPQSPSIFHNTPSKLQLHINSSQLLQRTHPYTSDEADDHKTIIFDLHGGGWVALGPLNHYTYQRKWTNLTGAPVFCLNYRKAPEHPFPQGLDDCWQVYNWLRDESHKYFKIAKEKEIILCGDSAGGNLSVALMNMLIDNDVKLPIYLLAIYPSLATYRALPFTPSHLSNMQDNMLSPQLIKVCFDGYIESPSVDTQSNYYLSPLFTPAQYLHKYPPTTILIGTEDLLHDQSIRFALKMKESGKRVRVIEYKGLTHAFMNFDVPGLGFGEVRQCIYDSAQIMAGVIEGNK